MSRGEFKHNREVQQRAAKKGGSNVPAEKRFFSLNRQGAIEAGRKGGQTRAKKLRKKFPIDERKP